MTSSLKNLFRKAKPDENITNQAWKECTISYSDNPNVVIENEAGNVSFDEATKTLRVAIAGTNEMLDWFSNFNISQVLLDVDEKQDTCCKRDPLPESPTAATTREAPLLDDPKKIANMDNASEDQTNNDSTCAGTSTEEDEKTNATTEQKTVKAPVQNHKIKHKDVPCLPIGRWIDGPCVHEGFYESVCLMEALLYGKIDQYIREAKTIILTGHSKGGAQTIVFAFKFALKYRHILKKVKDAHIHVVTFGAPRCGGQTFCKILKRELKRCVGRRHTIFQFQNEYDPVPTIPSPFLGVKAYMHAGTEIPLQTQGTTLFGAVTAATHALSLYKESLETYFGGRKEDLHLVTNKVPKPTTTTVKKQEVKQEKQEEKVKAVVEEPQHKRQIKEPAEKPIIDVSEVEPVIKEPITERADTLFVMN